jgi:DNA-directed RNA polymerase subunit delta
VFVGKEVQFLSLDQLSKEEISEMSLIELAYELLLEKKQAFTFNEIVDEIAKIADLSETEVRSRIAQFYTDINIDGRFLTLGENRWGLRVWYPVDQTEEDAVTTTKPKKKKAKKAVAADLDDFDEIDEEDYDDLDGFDEEEEFEEDDILDVDDDDDDDDDDLIDDDLDEVDEFDEDLEELDEEEDLDEELDEDLEELEEEEDDF